IQLVDVYGNDDDRSMEANNTSAFNCRTVGGSSEWSEHAYGRAIDINPMINPFVTTSGSVFPPSGTQFVDRALDTPGLIAADGTVVRAFASIGWEWGGNWNGSKDYQHFSETGR
ncbi:MAG: M15 family metallopeptidase, partial [Acidimicrobiia bacterium]|nr:M15 family metallopeptidase [Acidimicrobiia bacterium]